MRRFGPAWNPNMADLPEVPVPVGELCGWCDETIEPEHLGVVVDAFLLDGRTEMPWHYECWLRSTTGPVNHLKGLCKHGGNGSQPCFSPELTTKRQDAIAAVYFWEGREAGRRDTEKQLQFRLDSARRFFEGISKSGSTMECKAIAEMALTYMASKEAEFGRL